VGLPCAMEFMSFQSVLSFPYSTLESLTGGCSSFILAKHVDALSVPLPATAASH